MHLTQRAATDLEVIVVAASQATLAMDMFAMTSTNAAPGTMTATTLHLAPILMDRFRAVVLGVIKATGPFAPISTSARRAHTTVTRMLHVPTRKARLRAPVRPGSMAQACHATMSTSVETQRLSTVKDGSFQMRIAGNLFLVDTRM